MQVLKLWLGIMLVLAVAGCVAVQSLGDPGNDSPERMNSLTLSSVRYDAEQGLLVGRIHNDGSHDIKYLHADITMFNCAAGTPSPNPDSCDVVKRLLNYRGDFGPSPYRVGDRLPAGESAAFHFKLSGEPPQQNRVILVDFKISRAFR